MTKAPGPYNLDVRTEREETMSIDDWLKFLPTPYQEDFVAWLAARDKRIGSQHFTAGFRSGYEQGFSNGQGSEIIYEHYSRL